MSRKRKIALCVVAVALAAVFGRLGLWQLERHFERGWADTVRGLRRALPELAWLSSDRVPADTTGLVGRRVRLRGRWDRAGEVILRSRTLDGRAGAEVLTPLRVGDGGEVGPTVLVLRGWLPAPDGLRPDLAAGWRGAASGSGAAAEVEGVLVASRDGRGGQPLWVETGGGRHLAVGGLDLSLIAAETGAALSPHVVRADDPPPGGALRPASPLETGPGPHLSYAIQWFSFALIGLVGCALLLRGSRGA